MVQPGNVAASRGSSPALDARCGPVALLLLAALAPATAVAQRTPQPVFTELFAYDPAAPSQLLGKWLISASSKMIGCLVRFCTASRNDRFCAKVTV
jgi:hypothetical protein